MKWFRNGKLVMTAYPRFRSHLYNTSLSLTYGKPDGKCSTVFLDLNNYQKFKIWLNKNCKIEIKNSSFLKKQKNDPLIWYKKITKE